MTDYINSFFTKKSYVHMFMIFGGVLPFLGFYLFFKTLQTNPDSDLGINIFWLSMVISAACYYVATHLDLSKNCAGCDSRNLECLETQIHSFYEKTNKDGSPDKRYKNNRLMGYLNSTYTCIDCNAETLFSSKTSSNPSQKSKVRTATLTKGGSERKTKDDDNSLNTDIPSEPSNLILKILFFICFLVTYAVFRKMFM